MSKYDFLKSIATSDLVKAGEKVEEYDFNSSFKFHTAANKSIRLLAAAIKEELDERRSNFEALYLEELFYKIISK